MKTCQWCDGPFQPRVSYQIYCSDECRDAATKEKIAQKYAIAKRHKLMSKPRHCRSCGQAMSVYNDDQICNQCIIDPKDVQIELKKIKGLLNGKDKLD
jgi:predicted nucleic acid-binding Zn ribbon protein